jgi:hypothetical protein
MQTPTNWPNLNPYIDMFINHKFLIGDASDVDYDIVYIPEVIEPTIWPSLYSVINYKFLIGDRPEVDYIDLMPEYIEPTIWPSLYPVINYKFLIGDRPEVDYIDLMPEYIEPTIWPNINFYLSWHSLGRSNKLDYCVYDYSYNQQISIWPNVFKGEPTHLLGNAVDYEPIYKITLEHQWISSSRIGPQYIIGHMGGTLEDLLLPTLWSIENNLYKGFDTINNESPWSYTTDLTQTKNEHTPDIHEKFKFVHQNYKDFNHNYIGLLSSVIYPNIKVINNRFKNAKIIIISIDEDDLPEIMTNTVYKYWIAKNISEFQLVRLKRLYNEFYGFDMQDIKSLDKEFIDFWIKQLCVLAIDHPTIKSYANSNIDPDSKNVLIVKYKDFHTVENDSYVFLNKLNKFIDSKITDDVVDKYNLYLQKHLSFIEEFCPIKNI